MRPSHNAQVVGRGKGFLEVLFRQVGFSHVSVDHGHAIDGALAIRIVVFEHGVVCGLGFRVFSLEKQVVTLVETSVLRLRGAAFILGRGRRQSAPGTGGAPPRGHRSRGSSACSKSSSWRPGVRRREASRRSNEPESAPAPSSRPASSAHPPRELYPCAVPRRG